MTGRLFIQKDIYCIKIHQGRSKLLDKAFNLLFSSLKRLTKVNALQLAFILWYFLILVTAVKKCDLKMYKRLLDATFKYHKVTTCKNCHCFNQSCAMFSVPAFPSYLNLAVRDKGKDQCLTPPCLLLPL